MTNDVRGFTDYAVHAVEETRVDVEGSHTTAFVVLDICGIKFRMSAGAASGLAKAIAETSEVAATANMARASERTAGVRRVQ